MQHTTAALVFYRPLYGKFLLVRAGLASSDGYLALMVEGLY